MAFSLHHVGLYLQALKYFAPVQDTAHSHWQDHVLEILEPNTISTFSLTLCSTVGCEVLVIIVFSSSLLWLASSHEHCSSRYQYRSDAIYLQFLWPRIFRSNSRNARIPRCCYRGNDVDPSPELQSLLEFSWPQPSDFVRRLGIFGGTNLSSPPVCVPFLDPERCQLARFCLLKCTPFCYANPSRLDFSPNLTNIEAGLARAPKQAVSTLNPHNCSTKRLTGLSVVSHVSVKVSSKYG